jgi:deazaflavin-dependent oxidoreductase (nitroreductase family)
MTVATTPNPTPPWWLKPINKVMILLGRLGVGGDKGPLILTTVGRKSGKERRTPVTPMIVDGHRYIVGGFPGADWVRNAQARPDTTVGLGKRSTPVRLVEMSVEESRPLLRQFPTLVPTGVEFMRSSGLVTEGRPDEFEALAGRCSVFRVDPR